MNRRAPILLLIEPDAIQSVTLARALKSGGYSVIPVRAADDALETFVAHHMDIALVVADTQSATHAGPTLLEALQGIDPWVPVVAMSPADTIVGADDEYSNVAATLTKPVDPDDLTAHVQRVLESFGTRDLHSLSSTRDSSHDTTNDASHDVSLGPDQHVLNASTAPALCDWVGAPGDASFCWPPSDAELDEIHVLDTQSDSPWQFEMRPRVVRRTPGLQLVAPVKRSPSMEIVVRPFDDGRVKRRFDVTPDRWFELAAAAVCGLAVTMLWAVSGVSVKPAAIADLTSGKGMSHVISVRRAQVGMMPLVRADRVSSRFDRRTRLSDAFQKEHSQQEHRAIQPAQPERPAIALTAAAVRQRERIPDATDVTGLETRTANAAALPLPLVAARPPAPPAPQVEMAAARIEPDATRDVPRAPAMNRPREDERAIYQALQQYERAYERLDVDAARAVWPSLNTRALARAFDGLKEQALEFSHCRVVMESLEATAICGGRASYVPRVGPQTTRTEQREWTFRLRKVDHDWLIAKAEVR
jgi:CheY-like chemotaxis protein